MDTRDALSPKKADKMNNISVDDLPIGTDNIAVVTPPEQATKRRDQMPQQRKPDQAKQR
jgi:hypothetical protein